MADANRHPILGDLLGDAVRLALLAVVHTARTGNFARAAEKLGVTPSGVAKAVQRLELRLGAQIFSRTTRSLSLTATGALLMEHAERILDTVAEAEAALTPSDAVPRGLLRVSLAPGVGLDIVLETLLEFRLEYPELQLDIDLDSRRVDVVGDGFDIVLRTGAQPHSNLTSRKLPSWPTQLYAATSYLDRAGMPSSVDDLVNHACLRYRSPTTGRVIPWPLREEFITVQNRLPTTVTMNNAVFIRQAIAVGVGIGAVNLYAADAQVRNGSWRAVLPEACAQEESDNWLMWPPNRTQQPKIRAFINHVVKVFERRVRRTSSPFQATDRPE